MCCVHGRKGKCLMQKMRILCEKFIMPNFYFTKLTAASVLAISRSLCHDTGTNILFSPHLTIPFVSLYMSVGHALLSHDANNYKQ